MSSSATSEDELAEMVRRAAAAAPKQQRGGKKAPATAPPQDEDDAPAASAAGKQSQQQARGGKKAAQPPPQTQYEAWKAKQTGTKHQQQQSNTRDDDSSGDDAPRKVTGSRAQQRAASVAASAPKQREAKAARVPIKVERAKATRQADIDSGIAGALRDLAVKKKRKQQKKKAKQAAAAPGSEDEDDSDADSDDEERATGEAAASDEDEDAKSDSEEEDSESEDDTKSETGAEEVYDTVEETVAAYREQHAIHVMSIDEEAVSSSDLDSDEMFFPIMEFASLKDEFGLAPALVDAATGAFTKPSPIQAQCWPLLLGGKDVVGVATTGSGKTVAFLLPAIFYIMQVRDREARKAAAAAGAVAPVVATADLAPRALVLAPTRELAIQIHKVAVDITSKLSAPTTAASSATSSASSAAPSSTPLLAAPIQSYVVFGGTSIEAQLSSLRALGSLDLLVSTPGRLLKHLKENSLVLRRVGYFVLDEADRMLDLGFEEALKTIGGLVPANRQTALFSATWEAAAQQAASAFLTRGAERTVKVVVGSEDLTAAKSVQQVVEVVDRRQGKREKRLLTLLQEYHQKRENRILIFVLYKKEAALLSDHLNRKGWKTASISGDRTQAQRLEALERFRTGEVPILVATDVAARGLDVKNVTHVLNFSLGLSVEQYIHRVGRCGRAGAKGLAHTFVVDYDAPHTPQLVALLEEAQHPVSAELHEMAERAERQAAKHADTPSQQLKGDAYFVSLKSGALTRNVHLAKQLAKEAEEAEIEAKIFGDAEDDAAAGGVQKGKKQHAIHNKRAPGGGGGGGGQARKGKGRPK